MNRSDLKVALAMTGYAIGVTFTIIGIFASEATFSRQLERLDCNTSIVPIYLRNGDKAEYYISNSPAIQDPLLIEILDTNKKPSMLSLIMNTTSDNVIQGTIDSNNTGFYSVNVKFSSQCDQTEKNHLILSLVIHQNPSPSIHFLTIGLAIITGITGYFGSLLKNYLWLLKHKLSD